MKVVIYVLKDPRNGEVRYVGKTNNLERRLDHHIREAKKREKTYKARWIRGLLAEGIKPVAEVLETCDESTWQERERFWIAHFDQLVNTSVGGIGVAISAPRPSSWGRAISEARKGHQVSEESRELIRQSLVAKRFTHCKRGHEFTPENTYWRDRGKVRVCRVCRLMLQEQFRRRYGHHSMDDYPRAEFCKRGHPLSGDNLRILVRVKNGKEKIEHICRQCVRDRNRECKRRARAAGRDIRYYKPKPKYNQHKMYCKRGHLMEGDNLHIHIRHRYGYTYEEHVCRACTRERYAEQRRRMNDKNDNG